MKPEQLHQMAVSTNPNLGGCVMQLVPALSDTENYWGFQGYSPFQLLVPVTSVFMFANTGPFSQYSSQRKLDLCNQSIPNNSNMSNQT